MNICSAVKIQIKVGQSLLEVIRQDTAGWCQQAFENKSLLTSPSIVLPLHHKQTFPPIIWIFTEVEGDGIKSRLSFKIFSTLTTIARVKNTCPLTLSSSFLRAYKTFTASVTCIVYPLWSFINTSMIVNTSINTNWTAESVNIRHLWANVPFMSKCAIYGPMWHLWENVSFMGKCDIYGQMWHLWANVTFIGKCAL